MRTPHEADERSGLGDKTDGVRPVVAVRGLVAEYGPVRALDGVDLRIMPGEIVALLGPNGAGKTTLIETIVGLRPVQRGSVEILGLPVERRSEVVDRIGVQPQRGSLYQHLTVGETFALWGSLFGRRVDPAAAAARVGLTDKRTSRFSKLSGGQQQRVMLGLALVNDPALLILDEPTGSLDPHGRRDIWRAVDEHRRNGGTVLMATHSMEEAHALSTRVVIIDAGRVVAEGPAEDLIRRHQPHDRVRFTTTGRTTAERTTADLRQLPGVLRVDIVELPSGSEVTLVVESAETVVPLVLEQQRVRDVSIMHPTLEDVFVALTGRGLEPTG
jgi:ABC-2 type transport system ATP-binding protein